MNSPRMAARLLAAAAPLVALLGAAAAQTPDISKTAIQVQARGPVHEAFAQPPDAQGLPGPVVPREPPGPVPEEPPDLQPKGDNIQWIPGYWAWDADKNDFLWITGTYRDAPGGRKFAPGYWEQAGDGYRWVAGFWAPADQQTLPYVPPPPGSIETGPSVAPPGQDYTYMPGYWVYKEARYVWRPGYYVPCRPGLVWNPPRYVWTPGGCVFVSGYWDVPLENRGLLFAPVYFDQPLYATPGWALRPQYAVACQPLLDALFVDTRSGQYRFGDYYGSGYAQRGITPWHAYGPRQFDPLYGYYRWQNRGNPGWQAGLARAYSDRLGGKAARPPQTLVAQQLGSKGAMPVVHAVTPGGVGSVKLSKVAAPQVAQQKVFAQQQVALSQTRKLADTAHLAKTSGPAAAQGLKTAAKTALSTAAPITHAPATAAKTVHPTATPTQHPAHVSPSVSSTRTAARTPAASSSRGGRSSHTHKK